MDVSFKMNSKYWHVCMYSFLYVHYKMLSEITLNRMNRKQMWQHEHVCSVWKIIMCCCC